MQAEQTLALLAQRIAEKGDFPAVSSSLSSIVSSMRSEDADDSQLTDLVLSDFALTQKVLRLANSAMYSSFGGAITTVSKAVFMLGTETVGHLVLGLTLLDNLSDAAGSEAARVELSKSVVAGSVARGVAHRASGRDDEEVPVAALLQELGRLLVVFYLPELHAQIANSDPLAEEQAAQRVLGIGLSQLGRAMAEQLGLPEELAQMVGQADIEDAPGSRTNWLRAVSGFSNAYVGAVARNATSSELRVIASRYASSTGVSADELSAAALQATQDEDNRSLMRSVMTALPSGAAATCKPSDSGARLAAGVAEMRDLAGSLNPQQVVAMAMEVMLHSLGFERALFMLRKPAARVFETRIALGKTAKPLLGVLSFEEAFSPNVFHLALANNQPIFVADSFDAAIARRLPAWFREHLGNTKSFLLMPVLVNRQAVGLAYGDWGANAQGDAITADDMASLGLLRAQIADAFGALKRAPVAA